MPARIPRFSLSAAPEVFFTSSDTSDAIRAAVSRGEARELGPRLYTKNLTDAREDLVSRHLWSIVGGYVPGGVISDRTGFEMRPVDASLCLLGTYARDIDLPGLRIRVRKGPPRLEGDQDFMDGLVLASEPRRFLENLRPSRRRAGFRRALPAAALEDRLERMLVARGEGALNELRDTARELAPQLGAEPSFRRLDDLIGTLLGTRHARASGAAFRARRLGLPFDAARNELFDVLLAALHDHVAADRPARPEAETENFSFWEAYFSNYIEGTVFSVDVAARIVFENYRPPQRAKDAHDIVGTFQLANDRSQRRVVPHSAAEQIDLLRHEHSVLLSARPDKRPGDFKEEDNQAGSTLFVDPSLVRGTLHEGFRRYETLPAGFARCALQMFLLSEVHPFDDGNGRLARLRMNAELSAVGQQRIIIPTALRTDYLGALRGLSRRKDPSVLLRVLDRVQQYCHQIDWTQRSDTREQLDATNAFDEEDGRPLRLPSEPLRASPDQTRPCSARTSVRGRTGAG